MSSPGSVATAVAQEAAECARAKQQAAEDAMRRRAEQASKDQHNSRTRCTGARMPKGASTRKMAKASELEMPMTTGPGPKRAGRPKIGSLESSITTASAGSMTSGRPSLGQW